jgi:hypothetical protein
MDQIDATGGIDTLVQRTADMVELTLPTSMCTLTTIFLFQDTILTYYSDKYDSSIYFR